jgi:hypothetical protein
MTNQEAISYTAKDEISFQQPAHEALLSEEFHPPPNEEDYLYPTTDTTGKAHVSLDSSQHYEYPVFDKHHHNTYEEYDYSSLVYPLQNSPPSDYSHLTAEHHEYPLDGDHYHDRHMTYDELTPAEQLQMSPPSLHTHRGAEEHKYLSNGDDHYHHHLKNHIASFSVENEQKSLPTYYKHQVIKPYEYNKEYKVHNRSVVPKTVTRYATAINVAHLLLPNRHLKVNYFPHPEKHHTKRNPQEIYASRQFYLSSEKHDDYSPQTVEHRVNNHPQNTYHSPLVVQDHGELQDSSLLKYKEILPIENIANITSHPPKIPPSPAKYGSVTSNAPFKAIGDNNRLASTPKTYFDPKPYVRGRY